MIQLEDGEEEFEDCEMEVMNVVEQDNVTKTTENVKINYHAISSIVAPKHYD